MSARPVSRSRWLPALAGIVLLTGCLAAPPEGPERTPTTRSAEPAAAPVEPEPVPEVRAEGLERTAREATARVRSVTCDGVSTGSGVAVGDGLVLTNRHVVENADDVAITTWDGTTAAVERVGVSHEVDVALLDVGAGGPRGQLELADADPGQGDELMLLGHPGGGAQVVAAGPVLGWLEPEKLPDLTLDGPVLRLGVLVSPGSSGGPVLSEEGELAALVFAYESGGGHALAIPVSRLHDVVAGGTAALEAPRGC